MGLNEPNCVKTMKQICNHTNTICEQLNIYIYILLNSEQSRQRNSKLMRIDIIRGEGY